MHARSHVLLQGAPLICACMCVRVYACPSATHKWRTIGGDQLPLRQQEAALQTTRSDSDPGSTDARLLSLDSTLIGACAIVSWRSLQPRDGDMALLAMVLLLS